MATFLHTVAWRDSEARERRLLFSITVAVVAFSAWAVTGSAQELAPRAYWPAPEGTNLIVLGYQYSSGDVATDPTLPVTGVDSRINAAQVTYQRTLSLFDRTANLQFNLPYTWGSTDGVVEGELRSREISAMADARFLLSINLYGAPSMDVVGFQALRAKPRTIIGVSILIQPPTGDYEEDKVINAGSNRWSVKLATGLIWPVRPKLLLEADFGVWFFGDNDEFVGTTREQDPIVSAEFHLVKRIKPGFWGSLDANFYVGGRSTVGHEIRADLQRNSRVGATLVYPFKIRHALRASYSTGIVTNTGGDYDTINLNYAYAW